METSGFPRRGQGRCSQISGKHSGFADIGYAFLSCRPLSAPVFYVTVFILALLPAFDKTPVAVYNN